MLEVDGQTLAQSNAINCLLFSSRMTSAEALNQALCPKGLQKDTFSRGLTGG